MTEDFSLLTKGFFFTAVSVSPFRNGPVHVMSTARQSGRGRWADLEWWRVWRVWPLTASGLPVPWRFARLEAWLSVLVFLFAVSQAVLIFLTLIFFQ